jgi:DHA2 family lincomycin resistance protein-like MFS transporter
MLVIMYLTTFVAAFNENIMNVVLLQISQAFGIGQDLAQWLVSGYMVVASLMCAITGFLMERFSTRRLFFTATLALAVGELGCLLAPSFALLLAFRLLQAVGSGLIFPLMMSVVMTLAPREKLGLYLGIGTACITLGPATGPVISGLVDTLFSWRAVFVLPGIAAAALALAGIKGVRTLNTPQAVKTDAPSIALLAAGLFLFTYGLGALLTSTTLALVALAAAAVLLVLFCRRQFTLSTPVLNLACMRERTFWPGTIITMLSMMVSFSLSVLLPLYYEGSFGTTSLTAGLVILPAIIVNALTSLAGGKILDKRGAMPLLPAGFALIVVGQLAAALLCTNLDLGFAAIIATSVLSYAGVGLVMSPSQTAGLARLPRALEPAGAAVINTLIMIAASIGSSLFIGVMSAVASNAQAAGTAATAAWASGFSVALWVSVALAVVGAIASFAYARLLQHT